jgi:hypothetical protein
MWPNLWPIFTPALQLKNAGVEGQPEIAGYFLIFPIK